MAAIIIWMGVKNDLHTQLKWLTRTGKSEASPPLLKK